MTSMENKLDLTNVDGATAFVLGLLADRAEWYAENSEFFAGYTDEEQRALKAAAIKVADELRARSDNTAALIRST